MLLPPSLVQHGAFLPRPPGLHPSSGDVHRSSQAPPSGDVRCSSQAHASPPAHMRPVPSASDSAPSVGRFPGAFVGTGASRRVTPHSAANFSGHNSGRSNFGGRGSGAGSGSGGGGGGGDDFDDGFYDDPADGARGDDGDAQWNKFRRDGFRYPRDYAHVAADRRHLRPVHGADWRYVQYDPRHVRVHPDTGNVIPWHAYRPDYGDVLCFPALLATPFMDRGLFLANLNGAIFDSRRQKQF